MFLLSKAFKSNCVKIIFKHSRFSSTTNNLVRVNFKDGIKEITMCSPKNRNALSFSMMHQLIDNIKADQQDLQLRVIIIGAEGPVFSAGHNLKELNAESGQSKHTEVFKLCSELMLLINNAVVPVIAKVDGLAAAAGCQLVAQCDLAVCSEKSKFSTPGANFGIFCSTPGIPITRCVPKMTAMNMLLTGLPLSSQDAKISGLVSHVSKEGEVDSDVDIICKSIISKSRSVIELGKKFYYKQVQQNLKQAYEMGEKVMVDNLALADGQEGVESFIKKKKASWNHTFEKYTENSNDVFASKINFLESKRSTVLVSEIENASNFETVQHEDLSESEMAETESVLDWESDSSSPSIDLPGSWGTHGLEEIPWNDEDRPCAKFRNYENLKLNEVESSGVLTDRIIASGSSYLDRNPEINRYVICKVDLSKKSLLDIRILTFHHYLQFVNLSCNNLTDISCLGELPFLMYLDVSQNLLTEVLQFKAPFNLTYVNFSNNRVFKLRELSDFWSIVYLDLSHNNIGKIDGLQELKFLRYLNLSYNSIYCIENLNHMRLLTLNLQNNKIDTYEEGTDVGLKTLKDILNINLGNNNLSTLELFQGTYNVQSINMEYNRIEDLVELPHLKDLLFLTELKLQGNIISTLPYYIDTCIYNIKHLFVLDGEIIDSRRKTLVETSFNSLPNVQAIQNSARLLFLQQVNDPIIGSFVIPSEQAQPPIIILVGPPASRKGQIVTKFCDLHSKFCIQGISHTTRPKNSDEIDGKTYFFVSYHSFHEMLKEGIFLAVSNTFGNCFGLSQEEIIKIIEKRRALILHMDLTSALTLRSKGYRCNLVLAIPSTIEVHKAMIEEKYYNRPKIHHGMVNIENSPTKARQFLNESYADSTQRTSGEYQDASQKVKQGESEAQEKESSNINLISSKTSSILKTQSSLKTTGQQKSNVTFNKTCENEKEPYQPESKVMSSRSVTFNEVHQMNEFDEFKFSASATILDGEECKTMVLSVLSQPKFSLCDSNVFNIQTSAIRYVVDEIIKSRETYLDMHFNNPGLFDETIFTDKFDKALNKLKKLLKKNVYNQSNVPQHYSFNKDAVYTSFLATRLQQLHDEMNNFMSTSAYQKEMMAKTTDKKPLVSELMQSRKTVVETMKRQRHQAVSYKLPTESNVKQKKGDSDSFDEEDL